MADAGISEMILFIGAIVVATTVAATLIGIADDSTNSIESVGDRFQDQINAEILIVSDPSTGAVYDTTTNTLTLLVKNTGDRPLLPEETFVLVDGEYYDTDSTEVVDGESWRSGNVLRITVTVDLNINTEYRFTVRAETAEDSLEYFVT